MYVCVRVSMYELCLISAKHNQLQTLMYYIQSEMARRGEEG